VITLRDTEEAFMHWGVHSTISNTQVDIALLDWTTEPKCLATVGRGCRRATIKMSANSHRPILRQYRDSVTEASIEIHGRDVLMIALNLKGVQKISTQWNLDRRCCGDFTIKGIDSLDMSAWNTNIRQEEIFNVVIIHAGGRIVSIIEQRLFRDCFHSVEIVIIHRVNRSILIGE
jgi:hypothetical protein